MIYRLNLGFCFKFSRILNFINFKFSKTHAFNFKFTDCFGDKSPCNDKSMLLNFATMNLNAKFANFVP
ncbi:hypothetical protein [Campylobacter sp. JMF_04 NA10]|uniref:hypothetical protein n=1 Tax=Campylobacter sp. JMF_04 NA10 TaxID=2983824 RepID=UPI0022EA0E69|nr:hypothetical protein [Campylobacter sp. JMF_04 NA10]